MAKAGKFLQEVKTQMKKVAWPTKEELISSCVVVLIAIFLMGLFIGVCDFFFSRIVNVLVSGVL